MMITTKNGNAGDRVHGKSLMDSIPLPVLVGSRVQFGEKQNGATIPLRSKHMLSRQILLELAFAT